MTLTVLINVPPQNSFEKDFLVKLKGEHCESVNYHIKGEWACLSFMPHHFWKDSLREPEILCLVVLILIFASGQKMIILQS